MNRLAQPQRKLSATLGIDPTKDYAIVRAVDPRMELGVAVVSLAGQVNAFHVPFQGFSSIVVDSQERLITGFAPVIAQLFDVSPHRPEAVLDLPREELFAMWLKQWRKPGRWMTRDEQILVVDALDKIAQEEGYPLAWGLNDIRRPVKDGLAPR